MPQKDLFAKKETKNLSKNRKIGEAKAKLRGFNDAQLFYSQLRDILFNEIYFYVILKYGIMSSQKFKHQNIECCFSQMAGWTQLLKKKK